MNAARAMHATFRRFPARRLGAGFSAFVALWWLVAAAPASAADPLLEADRLYREQKYPAAIERLVELSLERPGDPELQDRLGAARFRAGDFEGAARAYDTAARLRGGGDADELFNAGNAYYKAGRLVDAAERYGRALASDPGHADAAHNRDLVEKEIAARRAIEPPPPPQPKPDGDDPSDDEGEGEDEPNDEPQQKPTPGGEPQKPGDQGKPQDPPEGGGGPPPTAPEAGDPRQSSQPGGQPQPPPTEPGSADAVSPTGVTEASDQQPPGDPTATAAGEPAEDDNAGPITAGQAHRLLDSIEEGGQRVVVQGKSGQKPW